MTLFVGGLLVAGYAVAALFFARFWRETGDRLFLYFAAAFSLLAVQRSLLSVTVELSLDPVWFYVIRLAAFVVIIAGIAEKNRSA
jgi:hypothetical protein